MTTATMPRRRHGDLLLAFVLGLAIVFAVAALPPKAAIALAVVAAFGIFVLFDTWHAVLVLLAARASLDVLSDVAIVGGFNGAALLTTGMIVVGLEYVARNRAHILNLPLAKPMLALLAISSLTIVIAPDPGLALEHWIRWLSTVLLFLIIVDHVRDEGERGKFLGALMLSALLPVLLAIYQFAAGEGNQATEGFNRVFGSFVHPSPFGVYLLTLLPTAAVLCGHSKRGWAKLGLFFLAVAMALCAVLTFTRIVWLGAVVIALVLGSAKTRATLVVLPLLVFAAVQLTPVLQDRFQGATETTGYESTGAWRIRHWDDQLAQTSLSTLPLGAGLGAVEYVLGQPAHNDYLRIWVELGLVGSAAYLWLLGSLVRGAVRNLRGAQSSLHRYLILAFLSMFVGRMVMSLTDNLLIQPVLEWYFWGLAAVALSLTPSELPSRSLAVRPTARPGTTHPPRAVPAGVRT
jgi:putative inorganic carbon (HCO3(-)) transporter